MAIKRGTRKGLLYLKNRDLARQASLCIERKAPGQEPACTRALKKIVVADTAFFHCANSEAIASTNAGMCPGILSVIARYFRAGVLVAPTAR